MPKEGGVSYFGIVRLGPRYTTGKSLFEGGRFGTSSSGTGSLR